MSSAPEFTDSEIAAIREMLVRRYQKEVEILLADAELNLKPSAPDVATCPTIFWHERKTNFVVFKAGPSRFRTRFFYTPHDQFGTAIEEFDNLEECVAAVLQTQSDHEREQEGVSPGRTGNNLN